MVHKGHSEGSGIFTIEQALGRAADNVKQSAMVGWEERLKAERLQEVARERGGLIISLDGLEPEGASETLWVV